MTGTRWMARTRVDRSRASCQGEEGLVGGVGGWGHSVGWGGVVCVGQGPGGVT
jgi:hypothetical protein